MGLAQLTPATPTPLLVSAAIVPATCVPCQELLLAEVPVPHSPAATQSPGSEGSASRALPSFPGIGNAEIMSYPPTNLPLRSGWFGSEPVSITATRIDAEPVVRFQAAGRFTPPAASK